jgi:hypothetical protein
MTICFEKQSVNRSAKGQSMASRELGNGQAPFIEPINSFCSHLTALGKSSDIRRGSSDIW